MLLIGCSKPQIQYLVKTEYKEVKVPTAIYLSKPNRPKYTNKDSLHTYLNKLIEYTKTLEIIIEENNKGVR